MPGPGDRGGVKQRPKNVKNALRRIVGYLSQFRTLVLLLLICSFVSNVGNLLGPSFSGKAITAASAGKGNVDMALVKHYALLMLVVYVGSNLVNFFVNFGDICQNLTGHTGESSSTNESYFLTGFHLFIFALKHPS